MSHFSFYRSSATQSTLLYILFNCIITEFSLNSIPMWIVPQVSLTQKQGSLTIFFTSLNPRIQRRNPSCKWLIWTQLLTFWMYWVLTFLKVKPEFSRPHTDALRHTQVVSHFIGFVPSISEHGYLSWGAFLLNNCIQQNWHINWMLKFDRNLGWSNAISFCELCFIGILNLNLFEIF